MLLFYKHQFTKARWKMLNSITSVGEKIKSIRRQNKMTQIEFAQSLEISQATLSEIESGKTKPSFDVLVLLADKYMVDMNWLIINRKVELHFGLQEDELKLLQNYRNLQDIAQEELLDYSMLKLQRYQRNK
ncbi:helix-turn-helix transcriptional regulator [Paenibacillus cisolokensis]|uniref:helix-turn-helix domain-containing protein n=1 Tax=Paenibacillus cisolokensis TaxID=1658519 RepID=UPI00110EFF44|nr:helix-turn-helix transcriptional regulator [Paenibacillus thermoaerophilus]